MAPDIWSLYALMLKSRLMEQAVTRLWQEGFISGEMHLGTGEEAIVAGVVSHLGDGDALALDHRATAALLMRGVDPVALLRELLGRPDGLCGGRGGHMHLFSKEHLAASSGIVGAAGPAAAGFALSAQYLRPSTVAVALFGEGAMNQGMLLESMNLASVRRLPVLFVCKDDEWAITTQSGSVTGGRLGERAQGLGVPAVEVDGLEVEEVWEAAGKAIDRARSGNGPSFIHARCVHLEGHFLGFQLLRATRQPLREMPAIAVPLTQSLLRRSDVAVGQRLQGLRTVISAVLATLRDPRRNLDNDPLVRIRNSLESDKERRRQMEDSIEAEISAAVSTAVQDRAT